MDKLEMTEKTKKLRDATIKSFGFSPESSQYKLLIYMTEAIFAEGNNVGIKAMIYLFKGLIKHPLVQEQLDKALGLIEAQDKEIEKEINETLEIVEPKKKPVN